MSKHYQIIKFLFIVCIVVVKAAPIDKLTDLDQDIWHKMFVRQFFVPYNLALTKNNQNDKFHQHDHQYPLNINDDITLKEISDIDLLSNYKKSISDFGTSYGFHPIAVAIFTKGVPSNVENNNNNDNK